ncbi:MAG TPA: hypothetical protein PKA33_01640 [Amaricoccus sp.]|uniref:hypothetical protein n=1 Tax=Amaricoccus sp. TaxID=1872485 RepID=UPI002C3BEE17|nr:hypothetical protein [Amaricoccus sp.]HMR51202.1 hypothetical protein [Amaricoccus sp.]HMT98049.1 hypothetical protein [Amaricoccus sp.]
METWYILEDGSPGDPAAIGTGADGKLRHRDGRAVAYGPHGPKSRGMSSELVSANREMRAEPDEPAPPKRRYRTRR